MQSDANDQSPDQNQPVADKSENGQVDADDRTEILAGDTSSTTFGEDRESARRAAKDRIGTKLGKYDIVEVLGQGGMGVVFRAHDPIIDRDVAIKLLSEELSVNHRAVQRLLVEAKSAGKLHHPNTVAIFEVGQQDQDYYLVMEYVCGGSMDSFSGEQGSLSVASASRVAADACKGLAAAHAEGLVHRDIKPANLLRSGDGTIKVADFGLAKLRTPSGPTITSTGQVLGTPHFMSPEQCEAAPVDARSDIYSLGATYYSLLTGKNPFGDSDSALHIMFAHCQGKIPDPRDMDSKIPPECSAIISRAMAKSPKDRYQTAEAMLEDLEPLAADEPKQTEQAVHALTDAKTDSWFHRNRVTLTVAGLVTAVLVSIFALAPFLRSDIDKTDGQQSNEVQGITDTTITLGTSTAFSGPSKELGQNVVLGIRTCFESVNDAGGIHGRKLELVALDDGYEPERALTNMKELFDKRKVFAVIGNVGTPTAKVTVPYAVGRKCLFFAPFTGASLLREDPPDRYVFNYRASYADETAAMVKYFVNIKGISPDQIAVFAQNDSYGDDGFKGVARALRALPDHKVSAEDIIRVDYERNTSQVEDAVEQIEKHRDSVRAIVMVPTYSAAARFIRLVRDRGMDVQFGVVSFVGSDALAQKFKETGSKYGEGVVVTQVVPHFQSGATGVMRYREQLSKYFPEAQPGFVSLEGFIAAECLVEGLKKAGPNLNTEKLADTLESINDLDLGIGPIIKFGPSRHQASEKVWGTILDDSATFQILELE